MRFLKTVYLKRYDEKTNIWSYKELKNVLVSGNDENYNLSDSLNRDAQITLRVMGDGREDILPQDIISFDEINESSPQSKKTYTVTAVSKNVLGSKRMRHTKVLLR